MQQVSLYIFFGIHSFSKYSSHNRSHVLVSQYRTHNFRIQIATYIQEVKMMNDIVLFKNGELELEVKISPDEDTVWLTQ